MSDAWQPAGELVERIRELNSEIDTEIARHLETLEPKASERAALIRQLRDRHGWSFRQIADAVGISHGRVQQILEKDPG